MPKAAEEIFAKIERERGDGVHREVTVSMMEIYNEKIHDLLMPVSTRKDVSLLHFYGVLIAHRLV